MKTPKIGLNKKKIKTLIFIIILVVFSLTLFSPKRIVFFVLNDSLEDVNLKIECKNRTHVRKYPSSHIVLSSYNFLINSHIGLLNYEISLPEKNIKIKKNFIVLKNQWIFIWLHKNDSNKTKIDIKNKYFRPLLQ